jgi:hypothetical protein
MIMIRIIRIMVRWFLLLTLLLSSLLFDVSFPAFAGSEHPAPL